LVGCASLHPPYQVAGRWSRQRNRVAFGLIAIHQHKSRPMVLSPEEWTLFAEVGLGLVAAAFVLSAMLCALARRWAPRFGYLDRPGGHKGHKAPTPLGGGLAIWFTTLALPLAGVLVAVAEPAWLPSGLARYAGGVRDQSGRLLLILALSTAIMVMGLLDDRKAIGWRPRLAVQVGLAIILAACGVRVTLFGPFTNPVFGGAITVLWVVGLTNAFNFLDNMDGLAAGVGMIAALLFVGAQVAAGSLFAPAVLLGLVGALAGFLVHNRHPARLFMGDAGSNFLGFLLGAMTVAGKYFSYESGESWYGVLAPPLVMAVPLYDSASVILIRLREGRSPFIGDRRHFSHRLVERGLTPPQAVRTINLVTLAGGLGALLLHRLNAAGAVVVVSQTLCLLGVVAILEASAPSGARP
jgi:UDP-GlcNAc:undecaprenyl-phosphate/decaprenyl-phosphate GlcNAc-1-phosphate transferase